MEIDVLKITYRVNQGELDFSVRVGGEGVITSIPDEVARMLRMLADRLDAREYPFRLMFEEAPEEGERDEVN